MYLQVYISYQTASALKANTIIYLCILEHSAKHIVGSREDLILRKSHPFNFHTNVEDSLVCFMKDFHIFLWMDGAESRLKSVL